MKNIILFTVILISMLSFSQSNSINTKFSYEEKGLVPRNFIVEVKGKNKDELLSKTEAWLKEKYKELKSDNDDKNDKTDKTDKTKRTIIGYEVFKDDELDEADKSDAGKANKNIKLRFTGFTNNAICFGDKSNFSCERLEYIIELRFRDGDYRFRPIKLIYKTASDKKEQTINLKKHKFYSKDGIIKKGYEKVSSQVEDLLNKMNKSLLNYLTDKPQEDEW
ncbi:hypothetical protein Q4Q39_08055 [Flavivirga amylovorans]|uniref:DUF4468 domain-containing protein n=1 Tax=Flavivirga amylovorans TaxID=870486 RepID=A0ABT8X094_9FLAO|nr:hypothetical protein [Flavivirga amylovorans]MDO5987346.1 hypothetical protein [Flavivirga amylovorans]